MAWPVLNFPEARIFAEECSTATVHDSIKVTDEGESGGIIYSAHGLIEILRCDSPINQADESILYHDDELPDSKSPTNRNESMAVWHNMMFVRVAFPALDPESSHLGSVITHPRSTPTRRLATNNE